MMRRAREIADFRRSCRIVGREPKLNGLEQVQGSVAKMWTGAGPEGVTRALSRFAALLVRGVQLSR